MNNHAVVGNQNKKSQKIRATNVLETIKNVSDSVAPAADELKGIASGTIDSLKNDLLKQAPFDILEQIMGGGDKPQKISGEIGVGEQINMKDVYSGKRQGVENQKRQFAFEKRMFEEEIIRVQGRSNELKIQLRILMDEVVTLASSTQDLGSEVKIAAMQAPIEPGIYHMIFFEKLLDFIKSFRKKIEQASVWLHVSNTRAEKKNYWAKYKKHGAKFLLSGEHYLTRSAG